MFGNSAFSTMQDFRGHPVPRPADCSPPQCISLSYYIAPSPYPVDLPHGLPSLRAWGAEYRGASATSGVSTGIEEPLSAPSKRPGFHKVRVYPSPERGLNPDAARPGSAFWGISTVTNGMGRQ